MKSFTSALVSLFSLQLVGVQVLAASVDWGGTYRVEYVEVDRTSLSNPNDKKAYILNHLNLSPKLIATDGVNIVANIEVLPNVTYPDSQLGQAFGGGSSATSSNTSNVAVNSQKSSYLAVNQLYLQVNQEYGTLIAGRAPQHFGLGITANAGSGMFDHWLRVRDMIGYKVLIGNLAFMPSIGKVSNGSLGVGGDITSMTYDLQYNNPETESSIGVYHEIRNASQAVNDANRFYLGPGSTPGTYASGSVTGGWNTTHTNVYFARGFEGFKFRMEAGFQSGDTGLTSQKGSPAETVKLGGYGIATEMDFPSESPWQWHLKMGITSGDVADTATFEGFYFSRNYDIAFLMFNHPLGKWDLFTTRFQRNIDATSTCSTTPCPIYDNGVAADEETISNAFYIAPRLNYVMSDRWSWTNTLAWAQLQTAPSAPSFVSDVARDVGFEWDTGLTYKPHPRITWETQLGFFFPGGAFKGTTAQDYGNSFTFGLQSRAAISF